MPSPRRMPSQKAHRMIDRVGHHHVVARFQKGQKRGRDGGHSGRRHLGIVAPFDHRHGLFDSARGGSAAPTVKKGLVLPAKARRRSERARSIRDRPPGSQSHARQSPNRRRPVGFPGRDWRAWAKVSASSPSWGSGLDRPAPEVGARRGREGAARARRAGRRRWKVSPAVRPARCGWPPCRRRGPAGWQNG